MIEKIKNIITKTDQFLYRKFGSDKSTKLLENIKEAQIIFSYLNDPKGETKVRFVGGCVRKAICGESIDDIDLATSLTPNQVKDKLNKENIQVIDTGISHGTVTAILKKRKFEITTLRKDISTDGRHAKVEFTEDWERDAMRRDFSINAIYVDIEGRIFDPLNGINDLCNGFIKFIGLPEERIQEDYLRILRYFRFFSQYSKAEHNQDIIRVIRKNINGLNKVSNERIFDEIQKILKLKKVYSIFSQSISKEIITNILPQFKYHERLKKISKLNSKIFNNHDHHLILAILMLDDSKDYEYFCHKYKASNNLKNRFKNISINFENLKKKNFFSQKNINKLIYFSNKAYVKDLLLFSIFVNKKTEINNIEKLIDYINFYKIPKFPISGDYLKKYGYESGEKLGKKLKFLENKWIEDNFVINKKELNKSLEKNKEN